jgi:hypothetical protein
MTQTAATKTAKYTVGQAVEIDVIDFATPGMPHVWASAVVESVTVMDAQKGLWSVLVRRADVLDRNGDGLLSAQIVGPRGGNKRIRAA